MGIRENISRWKIRTGSLSLELGLLSLGLELLLVYMVLDSPMIYMAGEQFHPKQSDSSNAGAAHK